MKMSDRENASNVLLRQAVTRSLAAAATLLLGVAPVFAAGEPAPAAPADDSLSWHGITLSGVVDIGLQYESHGAPISDYYPAGANDIVQPDSGGSVTGLTPSNLSQSNVAVSGKEPIAGGVSGVFKLQTFFNPQSGDLSDALKSLTLNNGKSTSQYATGIDSSVAGQLFSGAAYAGLSSATYGTLTFGRQTTLAADGIGKYDPNAASQAFSLIGLSGTPAGGGDTQDRRLDHSLKYTVAYDGIHFGAMYKFRNGVGGALGSGYQVQLGGEVAGFSIDAYYHRYNDAISVSALSASQASGLATLTTTATGATGPVCGGCTLANSLAATISDNSTWFVMASYDAGPVRISGGYEDIRYSNPSTALPAGSVDIGGYLLAYVNNTKFTTDKTLDVYWLGAKWKVNSVLDLTAAYYGEKQQSYLTGTTGTCSTTAHGNCSGTLSAYSLDAVYHFSKRFDGYAGLMSTSVADGLASGYVNTSTIDPTVGVRFKF